MDVLWDRGGWLSVADVRSGLGGRRRAYTTVMTVLTRLHDKGLVERERRGRAYVYRAGATADHLTARRLREVLEASTDPRAVLAHFVEEVRASPQLQARLQALLGDDEDERPR